MNKTKKENSKSEEQQKVEKKEEKSLIYCGPSIPDLPLLQYAVFNKGVPSTFQKTFKECKEIERLFLPIDSFPRFKKKVSEVGSAEYQLFNKASEYVRGEK